MAKTISAPAYFEAKDGSFISLERLFDDFYARDTLLPGERRKFNRAINRLVRGGAVQPVLRVVAVPV